METEDFDVELAKTYELARQLERELTRWQALAGQLAQLVEDASERSDDADVFMTEWESSANKALAAYEAATSATTGKPETVQ